MIKFITSWILKAFSGFVPELEGCKIGASFSGRRIEQIQPLPLNKISPTSEISSLFFPYMRHMIYNILPLLGAVPKNAYLCSSPRTFRPSLKSFRSSPKTFWPCLKSFSPSLERFCPYPGKFCPQTTAKKRTVAATALRSRVPLEQKFAFLCRLW